MIFDFRLAWPPRKLQRVSNYVLLQGGSTYEVNIRVKNFKIAAVSFSCNDVCVYTPVGR